MGDITVHVLNFHGIFSHIEIVLENTSVEPHSYYGINRWAPPESNWILIHLQSTVEQASSVYSFNIKADPNKIVQSWSEYWGNTQQEAHVLGKNCAVAAQWFLKEFAGVPEPSLANISFNHLAFGIMWPSFIACPVTLPGRIMSNAKFHIEQQNNLDAAKEATLYTGLFVFTSMSLATLAILPYDSALFALTLAIAIIAVAISPFVIAGYFAYEALCSDSDEINPLLNRPG